MNPVTKALIGAVDWLGVEAAGGSANAVPGALADLFAARSEEEARAAYWSHLDNEVVVQGQLFEAAGLVIAPLLVEVASHSLSPAARYRSVELLVEIALGVPASGDDVNGQILRDTCQAQLRQGLSTLYALLSCDDERVVADVIDVLEVVEPDSRRLVQSVSALGFASDRLRRRVEELLRCLKGDVE